MHEYQALRKRYDFLTLCNTPELICEVTHLPIQAFGLDAAIIFSDILLILETLGYTVRFEEEVGPVVTLGEASSKLESVLEGIKLVKKSLHVPLIGFAGAPFTVASYAVGGLKKTKQMLLEDPEGFDALLDRVAVATIDYLNAQINVGCDAIQIFDSWAMHVPASHYDRLIKKPIEKIVKKLKKCPVILFCRGNNLLGALKPQALSFDWTNDLAAIRKLHPDIALQGNLDPDILLTTPKVVERETKRLLDSMKGDPAFICNLGHGIHKETPRENVVALVECVKSYG
jgi:uroporphyrinogen decarboxylase